MSEAPPYLDALEADLRAAPGPDRLLDARLWDLIDDRPREEITDEGPIYKRDREDSVAYDSPPGFTGSIDQAVRLIRRRLPGWLYRVASCSVSDDAWIAPDFLDPVHGEAFKFVFSDECQRDPVAYLGTDVDLRPPGREAIALCISLVRALKKLGMP